MTWLPKLARDIQDLWRLGARRRLQREAEHQWQNLQHGFGAWPKTCSDFALGKACFLGMPASHPTMATNYPFRPCIANATEPLAALVDASFQLIQLGKI